ncbi:MAG: helix-turn-helix domain-containing protein [Muribaculaceae bacterium]|nr:helix-turn-helix domain-containing protein [Muribaculaceae bacterium]
MNKDSLPELKYSKSACGVEFMLNVANSSERPSWFGWKERYATDFFEFYFFRRAQGFVVLDGEKIEIHDDSVLIISPHQHQEWHVETEKLDYTFLIFQENFLANVISAPYFVFRLHFCFQHDHPVCFSLIEDEKKQLFSLLKEIKQELLKPGADSFHLIAADLFKFLILFNRIYSSHFSLSQKIPTNLYAFKYKELLENKIRSSFRVADYARMLGISRIALNKAVDEAFGVTAVHLLKQRLLQEIKNDLIYTAKTPKAIASELGFSAPNHLMRFFKQHTGQTIGEYLNYVQNHGHD